jgi:DNA-binding MarR family transcriptional regulator
VNRAAALAVLDAPCESRPVMAREDKVAIKHDILMLNLLSAIYWFDEALQAKLEAIGYAGLNRTQSLLLANIGAGEHRAIRIARNLGVTRQAISQMLADLEAREIVAVSSDPDDKRARIVDFHPNARRLRRAASQILGQLEATLAERIGQPRVDNLREALASDWGDPPRGR